MTFKNKNIYALWVDFQYKNGGINCGGMSLQQFISEGEKLIDETGGVSININGDLKGKPIFSNPVPNESFQ